eukprot:TRINITY_DN234_c0_g1_i1.p1 TRINITY_DN234_c0_g1~~TRINITY_DN234_c0_g1_i1.p1  ORF type:complete len:1386 (+),score=370.94 TRINITY_DN234_c0_g1_i1:57-4160(+)
MDAEQAVMALNASASPQQQLDGKTKTSLKTELALATARKYDETRSKLSKRVESVLFEGIYAMNHKNARWKFEKIAILGLFIEFLQIISFSFSPDVGWHSSLYWLRDLTRGVNLSYWGSSWMIKFIMQWVAIAFVLFTTFLGIYVFKNSSTAKPNVIAVFRILCTLGTTVLFMPFMLLLLSSIDCSYGTASVTLRNVGSVVECWSIPHVIVYAGSCLAMLFYFLFSCFYVVLSFEYDPRGRSILRRPSARLDLLALLAKVGIIINALWNDQGVVVRQAVLIAIAVIFVVYTAVMLPYYVQGINQYRCALYTCSMWVPLCAFMPLSQPVATVGQPVLLLIGMVVAFAVGGLLPHARYVQLVNKPWAAYLDDSELQAPRFSFAFEAEISTRHLQVLARENDGVMSFHVRFAEWLFNQAVDAERFAHSTFLPITFAVFVTSYIGDKTHAVAVARSSFSDDPWTDERFLIYILERKSDTASQTMMTEEEFQSHYQLARRYHAMCVTEMGNFWRLLLKTHVSMSKLPTIARKIESAEKRASREYAVCHEAKPLNTAVLRDYADFMEIILNDREGALQLLEKADTLEERRKRRLGDTVEKDDASADLSQSTKTGSRRNGKGAKSSRFQFKTVAVLKRYIQVALLLLVLLAVASFLTSFLNLNTHNKALRGIDLATQRRATVHHALTFARQMRSAVLDATANASMSYDLAYQYLDANTAALTALQRTLFTDYANTDVEKTSVTLSTALSPEVHVKLLTLVDAVNTIIRKSVNVLRQTKASLASSEQPNLNFLALNIPEDVTRMLDYGITVKQRQLTQQLMVQQIISGAIFGLTIVIIISLGLFMFRPTFNEIMQERNTTLQLFLAIPSTAVNGIIDSLRSVTFTANEMAGVDGDDDDDNDDLSIDQLSGTGSGTDSHTASESGSRSATGSEKTGSTGNSSQRRRRAQRRSRQARLFRRLTLQYVLALSLYAVVVVVGVIVTLVMVSSLQGAPAELNEAGKREYIVDQLHAMSRELMVNDASTWPRRDARFFMKAAVDQLQQTHNNLKFGSAALGLSPTDNRYAPQTALMYTATCLLLDQSECVDNRFSDMQSLQSGLDSLLQRYMAQVTQLLNAPDAAMTWSNPQLAWISYVDLNDLQDGLARSRALFVQEADERFNAVVQAVAVMFTISILTVILLFFLFKAMVDQVAQESQRTHSLLMMIPPAVREKVEIINSFLEGEDVDPSLIDRNADNVEQGLGAEWEAGGVKDEDARVDISADGIVVYINHLALLMFGCDDESEVLNKPVEKFLSMSKNLDNEPEGIVQLAMGFRSNGTTFPVNVTRQSNQHEGTYTITMYRGTFDRVLRVNVRTAVRATEFWTEWPAGTYTDAALSQG